MASQGHGTLARTLRGAGCGQAGITLIELMFALAVAAVLVTLAIPGLTATVLDNRRTTALNDLLASLHGARSEAITRNARVTFCPSDDGEDCAADWSAGWLTFLDADGDARLDGDETALGYSRGYTGIDVFSDDFVAFLVYRPNGRAMVDDIRETGGEFMLCDRRGAGHARVAIIDASGRPRASRVTSAGDAPAC